VVILYVIVLKLLFRVILFEHPRLYTESPIIISFETVKTFILKSREQGVKITLFNIDLPNLLLLK